MPSSKALFQMIASGAILCIGGPALIYYVSPTEEELFKRYNPELQKRSLENRLGKQQDFDDFVNRLKQASKSEKPIWEAIEEMEEKRRQAALAQQRQERADVAAAAEALKKEIRDSAR